jgi:hypothetical protein
MVTVKLFILRALEGAGGRSKQQGMQVEFPKFKSQH